MMKKFLFTFILFITLLGTIPFIASAHATPLRYIPDIQASVLELPPEIKIIFSEEIDPVGSNIRLFWPDGAQIDSRAVVDDDDRHALSLSIPMTENPKQGSYTVSWEIISRDDGHFTQGAYTFNVSTSSPNSLKDSLGTFQIYHSSTIPEATSIGFEILGQAMLLGLIMILLVLKLSIDPKQYRLWIVTSLSFILIGIVAYLSLKSSEFARIKGIGFLEAVYIFIQTSPGFHALIRSLYAILALMYFFFMDSKKPKLFPLLILCSLMIWDRTIVSHAGTSTYPILSTAINFIHLWSKELWVGSILTTCLLKIRFLSKMTAVAVMLVALTGGYIVWLHLKDFSNLFLTSWGHTFIILSIIGAVAVFLGLLNRRALEASFLVILVFVTSSIMITTPPLREIKSFAVEEQSQGRNIQIQSSPYYEKTILIKVEAEDTEHMGDISVTATNEDLSIGPIAVPIEKIAENMFIFSENAFNLPGKWTVKVAIEFPGYYDSVVNFSIDYPNDVNMGMLDTNERSLPFTITIFLITIAIVLAIGLVSRYHLTSLTKIKMGPKEIYIFILPLCLFCIFILLLPYGISDIFKSSFQKACEKRGDYFHEGLPMKNGAPLSHDAVLGCTVGSSHIPSFEEYQYFVKPLQSSVIMESTPFGLNFNIVDEDGTSLKNLSINHEKLLHLIIINEDFTVFDHVHPEKNADGTFSLAYTFPTTGRYSLSVDYMINAENFSQQFFIDAPDTTLSPLKDFNSYDVSIDTPERIRSGEITKINFHVEREGLPITNLAPYLSAPMHIALIRDDLLGFTHTHGFIPQTLLERIVSPRLNPLAPHNHLITPPSFGPSIEAFIKFPTPGNYIIFGEFLHENKVITSKFIVSVE